jgi:hypothetical protein
MKTTIDIADDLLRRARRTARQENITLKTLAEEGLRLAIERRQRKRTVEIKPHVVTGKAMPTELSWDRLREVLYGEEGRSLRG